ncbi:MAG: hypothetical protein ACSHYF_11475 [Verrucomicrobiaceae bacterium]
MMLTMAQIPEWVLIASITLFLLCVVGGVIKFVQTVKFLFKGPPPVDENLVITEEDFKDHE